MLNFATNLLLIYDLNLLTVCFTALKIPSPFVSRNLSYLESLLIVEVLL